VIPTPDLSRERQLFRAGADVVAGMDEVGRGAIAGPVSVGVVAVPPGVRSVPKGVRDSKLLRPEVREALAPRIRRWAPWHAVGHASAEEIDAMGIIAALRLAGLRALALLPVLPDLVLLDGSHDWLTPPVPDLFATEEAPDCPPVIMMIKGDLRCSTIAAASVLAKIERDAILRDLAAVHPDYGWSGNKGYATPDHIAALRSFGTCDLHRRSWELPGLTG
jgi:ribonuclease HII